MNSWLHLDNAVANLQEAAGHIASAGELPVALAHLTAVRHSLHGGPIASAGLVGEFAVAAVAAEAAVETAVTSMAPDGRPCSTSEAADLAAQLECLEVAASVTLPAAAADQQQAAVQGHTQLAVAAMQRPAAQVQSVRSSHRTFGGFSMLSSDKRSLLTHPIKTVQTGGVSIMLNRVCFGIAGAASCDAAGGAALRYSCCGWGNAAGSRAACHGGRIPTHRGENQPLDEQRTLRVSSCWTCRCHVRPPEAH